MKDKHSLGCLLYPTVTSSAPIIVKGRGARLYDENGKDYIDGSSGVMICNLGHGNKEIAQIAQDQMSEVAFLYRAQFRNLQAERLAQALIELAGDKSHAFFLNSGSEANDAAIRLAVQYWREVDKPEKLQVIGREISNHGNTVATLSVAQNKRRDEIETITLPIGANKIPACYCYRCPMGKSPDSCAVECADALEHKILQIGADKVAAFIAEPITAAAGGVLIPHQDYFKKIRAICDKHDVLLIVDEVVTGLGRTGRWFGMHHYGIEADITVLGKGLNAGYTALSAVLINQRFFTAIEAGSGSISIGHTHSGNPLSTAIAMGVLDYLKENKILEQAEVKGQMIKTGLMKLQQRFPVIGDVRSIGMLSAIEFVKDPSSKAVFEKEVQFSKRVYQAAMKSGLVVYACRDLVKGDKGDALLIAPPLNSTVEELTELLFRLETALTLVCREMNLATRELSSAV